MLNSYKLVMSPLTSFLSLVLVNMTIVADFCSQTILQKSPTVSGFGPENKTKNIENQNIDELKVI